MEQYRSRNSRPDITAKYLEQYHSQNSHNSYHSNNTYNVKQSNRTTANHLERYHSRADTTAKHLEQIQREAVSQIKQDNSTKLFLRYGVTSWQNGK